MNSGLPDGEPGTAAGVAGFGPLLIDPQNPKILYLGNYRCGRYQPSDCDSRLFNSTDGGESWNATSAPIAGYLLVSLAIDPQNTRTIRGRLGRCIQEHGWRDKLDQDHYADAADSTGLLYRVFYSPGN